MTQPTTPINQQILDAHNNELIGQLLNAKPVKRCRSKFTQSQCNSIRALYEKGYTYAALAQQMGVSIEIIRRVIKHEYNERPDNQNIDS